MTYHDGNRAAKFRSSRLGAAVEQITGKRTELSLGATGSSARAKPKKARVTKDKEKEAAASSPLSPKGNGTGKGKGNVGNKGKRASKESPSLQPITEVPAEQSPVIMQIHTGPVGAAPVIELELAPSIFDLACEEDSDEDVFDDNYKKPKSFRRKGST